MVAKKLNLKDDKVLGVVPCCPDLLANALEALDFAVESLEGTPTDRDLRRAVRELSTGIEVALKAVLLEEHWSLIFADPSRASLAALGSGEFTSVALDDSLKRIETVIGHAIPGNQRRWLEDFRRRRNRLEHLGEIDNIRALRPVTARALHATLDLISSFFDRAVLEKAGHSLTDIVQRLTGFDEFVKTRLDEIRELLAGERVVECPSCRQLAAVISDGLSCRFCEDTMSPERSASKYASVVLDVTMHDVVKDGVDWPVLACPSCGLDALVPEGHEGERYVCFGCGEDVAANELVYCTRCGEPFSDRDRESGLCERCWENLLAKD